MTPPAASRPDDQPITDRAKVLELLAAIQSGTARRIDETEMATALKRRVRGQDEVIDDLSRLVRKEWGKTRRKKPVASLLFLGPTGTGKSELAKAIAEYLYGDEKHALIFDGPDLSGPEAKIRLTGISGPYRGSEDGGKLTRPMLNNPKRVVVFEEIEKAWAGVFDLFLAMLGDGRLTEQGEGSTERSADFTQSVVILTSNAEHDALSRIAEQVDDPHERTDAVKKHLAASQVFRPEILGRFDRVYIFRPLSGIVLIEIAELKAAKAAREYDLELTWIDPELLADALVKSQKLASFGIRELERIVNELLGDAFLDAKEAGMKSVSARMDEDGQLRVQPS